MLVFMCLASTALYLNMEKRMSSLMTFQFEGDTDGPSTDHSSSDVDNEGSRRLDNAHNRTSSAASTSVEETDNGLPPFAYMFLIGGIDPAKPGYRGFVYNVMIACDLLRSHGSKADFLLFLQMSPNTDATTLPEPEARALETLGVQTVYMEKPETASFTDINMEKFRILSLTQYQRVLFLDADILPLVNMDYLMELSLGERPLIKPNFVVATLGEPANGGCFMLEPKEGAYEALLKVVENQRISAQSLSYPYFDRRNGWGHSFKDKGDDWKGTQQVGKMWRWHGSHVDQGLLFYWTKYHQQTVTIFRGNIVENWAAGGETNNNQPFLESSMDPSLINKYAPPEGERIAYQWSCDNNKSDRDGYLCKTPYYNYAHFTGSKKPWQTGYNGNKMKRTDSSMLNGAYRAWFTALFDLSTRLGWEITPENVDDKFKAESPFGYMPNYADFARRQQGANYTNREGVKVNTSTQMPKVTEATPEVKEEPEPPPAEKDTKEAADAAAAALKAKIAAKQAEREAAAKAKQEQETK